LQKIRDGKLEVFSGPLKDNHGRERLAVGKVLSNLNLASTNWTVDGVECAVSSK